MNGGDDCIGTFERNHVVAIRDNDLAATGRKMSFADLQVVPPNFLEGGEGLHGKTRRQGAGVGHFSGGEDDERLIAEISRGAHFVCAGAPNRQLGRSRIKELRLLPKVAHLQAKIAGKIARLRSIVREAGDSQIDEHGREKALPLRRFLLLIGIVDHRRRHSLYLVFMRGVDENHTDDFARIGSVIHADVVAAKGMTDKDVRRLLASDSKKGMEFLGDFGAGARHGTCSAPTVSGAIVGADASKFRHFGLNEVPIDGRGAKAAFKNHGGRTVAGTIEIERGVREFRAKGERFSLLWETARVGVLFDGLI